MSTGRIAKEQTSREKSQPPTRGQNFVATAKHNPTPEKSSRLDSGTIQRKCRLIRQYIRWLGLMLLQTTLVPTSSNPPARPHQADRTSTSGGPSRRWVAIVKAVLPVPVDEIAILGDGSGSRLGSPPVMPTRTVSEEIVLGDPGLRRVPLARASG
jgi:hypothetical protein